ncbi:MAG: polysaccharide biosynthesis/export family protein [Pseudomonadota bacterium]
MMNVTKIKELYAALIVLFFLSACTGSSTDALNSSGASSPRTAQSQNRSQSKSTTSDVSGLRVVNGLPAPATSRDGQDQLLLVGDILEIDVFQVDELDKTVQIDSSGRVSMPLIGQVEAASKTVASFEQELESRYGVQYLQSPEVTVLVKESVGRQVTLDGEFLTPGVYPTRPGTTLIQAVAQARGLSPLADEDKVFVYRDHMGEKVVAKFNVAEIRAGNAPDPNIYGGDIIVAFKSDEKVAQQNLKDALGVAVNATRVVAPF